MDQEEVLELWEKFGNIPVTNHGELKKAFYIWSKGESVQTIHDWFDEHYHGGIQVLLHSYA